METLIPKCFKKMQIHCKRKKKWLDILLVTSKALLGILIILMNNRLKLNITTFLINTSVGWFSVYVLLPHNYAYKVHIVKRFSDLLVLTYFWRHMELFKMCFLVYPSFIIIACLKCVTTNFIKKLPYRDGF